MNSKDIKLKCDSCLFEIAISDKKYKQILLLYKKLYETEKNQGDIKTQREEILKSVGVCPTCGSIFREYMCKARHICTAFKNCPICGNEASLLC
ncbi:hypothetical protein ES705_13807 [subsurface metagenome]